MMNRYKAARQPWSSVELIRYQNRKSLCDLSRGIHDANHIQAIHWTIIVLQHNPSLDQDYNQLGASFKSGLHLIENLIIVGSPVE
jgi:hypothetical protein